MELLAAPSLRACCRYTVFSAFDKSVLQSTAVANWSQNCLQCMRLPSKEGTCSLGSLTPVTPVVGAVVVDGVSIPFSFCDTPDSFLSRRACWRNCSSSSAMSLVTRSSYRAAKSLLYSQRVLPDIDLVQYDQEFRPGMWQRDRVQFRP